LSLYGSQNPETAPKSLFLLAPPKWDQDADLASATKLPLQRILPFDGVLDAPSLPTNSGEYVAALGVLSGLARVEEKGQKNRPDFLNPKQPPPPSQMEQQRVAIYAFVGFLAFLVVGWFLWGVKSRTMDELDTLTRRRDSLKKEFEDSKVSAKRYQALGAWDDVVWLDEIYDISHRIPNTKDLQLTEISASPRRNPEKETDFRSHLTIKGTLPGGPEKREALKSLLDELRKDGVYKIEKEEQKGSDFTLEIDVKRRPPNDYNRKLVPAAKPELKTSSATKGPMDPEAGEASGAGDASGQEKASSKDNNDNSDKKSKTRDGIGGKEGKS
jgi:nitrogen fixation-related uncharacterized protein